MKEQGVLPEAVSPPTVTAAPGPAPPAANGAVPPVSDFLEEAPKGSEGEENISTIIRNNIFDPDFSTRWKPYRVELIDNKRLDEEYDEKRQDLLIRGRKGHELEEEYGFTVQPPEGTAGVVTAGLQAREADYNPLGYSRLGVYLCRHPDVCLQHALLQQAQPSVIRLIVCKYIKGRTTTAIPRPASSAGFIEPTQGYDGHTSALRPGVSDPLQTQYDRSQIYLYEINKLLQPSSRPRQVLPLAVVTLTEEGVYVAAVDAKLEVVKETLPSSPLTVNVGNPRLAQIIDAINARSGNGSEKGLLGSPTAAGSPDGVLVGGARGLRVVVGGSSANTSPDVSEAPSPKLAIPHSHINLSHKFPVLEQAIGPAANGLMNGHLAGLSSVQPGRECMGRGGLLMEGIPAQRNPALLLDNAGLRINGDGSSHKALLDAEGNPQLALVISKINARLQTETKPSPAAAVPTTPTTSTSSSSSSSTRPLAVVPAQGDGLLPLPHSATGLSLNNGNLVNGNGGGSGSSSLGSRPGSADSMLSGAGHTPVATQCGLASKLPAHLLTSGNAAGNHSFGYLTENSNGDTGTTTTSLPGLGMPKAGMTAQLAAGLPFTLGFSHGMRTGHNTATAAAAAAGLLGRKDGGGGGGGGNVCLDAYNQMLAAGGMAGLYQSLHGQPIYTDRLGHPQPTAPTHAAPALSTTNPGLHALHTPYQVLGLNMGFGPTALTAAPTTPMSAAPSPHHPHLNSLHQSTLALRSFSSPLKRPYPEASAALEWDKRPKFF